LEIRHADVASLRWKILRDLLILLLCDLHDSSIQYFLILSIV
jgi:hypothetical protein